MKQALDSKDEALAEKGAVGRQRVHEMHDAAKNAELLIEAIARKKLP
jgi:hypothetical protein